MDMAMVAAMGQERKLPHPTGEEPWVATRATFRQVCAYVQPGRRQRVRSKKAEDITHLSLAQCGCDTSLFAKKAAAGRR